MKTWIWSQRNQVHPYSGKRKPHIQGFEPFILSLLVCGIPVKDSGKCYNAVALAVRSFLVTCWLITVSNTINCMVDEMKSFYVFTLVMKIITLICWTSMYIRRRNFLNLLQILKVLQKKGKTEGKNLTLIGRLAILTFFVIILMPPIRAASSTNKAKPTCHEFWIDLKGPEKTMYNFALSTARIFTNWAVTFSATIFYSLYCIEIRYKITAVCQNINIPSLGKISALEFYDVTVSAITKLENSMSLTMLFVLFTNFTEMFRVFTIVLFMLPKEKTFATLLPSYINFLQTAALFLVLVLSADCVQNHFDILRKHVFKSAQLMQNEDERFRKKLKIIEDRDFVKLTAWGIFEIKRTLVLSAVASLITYGFLLQNLKK